MQGIKTSELTFWSVIVTLLCLSGIVWAAIIGQGTLSWEAPTTNIDGSPLTDLMGYKVYYGLNDCAAGTIPDCSYGNVSELIPDGTTTKQITLPDVHDGEVWYFVVTALDTSGNESPPSEQVPYVINLPPSSPTRTSVNIILQIQ